MKYAILFIVFIGLISCSSEPNDSSAKIEKVTSARATSDINYSKVSSQKSGIGFKNFVTETATRNVTDYDYMYNGAGVAIADFDNDGLSDIFFCGNDAPNAIYRNNGGLVFEERSSTALPKQEKWSFGVTTVDINRDGYIDLYVSNSGPSQNDPKLANQLLINNGDFTFTDEASKYGLASVSNSVQAEFFDYDNDGDLDLWLNNHGNSFEINKHIKSEGYNDLRKGNRLELLNKDQAKIVQKSKIQLFRNEGGKFTDVSVQAGVSNLSYGLGLSVADYNDDGFLDVYVANDYWVPDYYFINNGNGTFVQNNKVLNHTSYYSMGSDAADYNNDGLLDLVVVDMTPKDHYRNKTLMESMDVKRFMVLSEFYKFPRQYMFNSFQLGVGGGYFNEIANGLDVSLTEWSWAPLLLDMNNSGYSDLYISNGYFRDTKNQDARRKIEKMRQEMGSKYTDQIDLENLKLYNSEPVPNAVFANTGKGEYEVASSTMSSLGKSFSNGVAYGDLDNDGDLDLVINNFNSTADLLENKAASNNYLRLKLSSKNGIQHKQAKVEIYSEGQLIRKDNSFTRGYLSAMEPIIHTGLGAGKVDSVLVYWRDGTTTKLDRVMHNSTVELAYESQQVMQTEKSKVLPAFMDASAVLQRNQLEHKEDYFNDFEKEILLPQKMSSLGPALCTGDVDGDGLEDFFMGGSKGQRGRLMLMKATGFVEVSAETFESDKNFEDLGAVFFDANQDGLLDLYVASGAGGELESEVLLMDRIYYNQGKANFKRNIAALPQISSSTKAVAPLDFDNDGDMDLFVGGRNVPGKYPDKAESYLLENKNGKFVEKRTTSLKETTPNMVTDAVSADINQDGYADLVLTGEWSAPRILYNNQKGDFKKANIAEIDDLEGWWFSVSAADINRDGRQDFVLGNLGINNKFHSSPKNPLKLRYDDFDGNGSQDIVLTKNYAGKEVPVRGKECSSEQMPVLNSKFKTYDAFASASIFEILGEDKINKAKTLQATYFKSVALLSNSSGYQVKELPLKAQLGPILDSKILDLNRDGHLDIILAGKIVNTEPETPSYDANSGTILYGNGQGDFVAETDLTRTGLNLKYNAKQISICNRPDGYGLVVANNNGPVQLFVKR